MFCVRLYPSNSEQFYKRMIGRKDGSVENADEEISTVW